MPVGDAGGDVNFARARDDLYRSAGGIQYGVSGWRFHF